MARRCKVDTGPSHRVRWDRLGRYHAEPRGCPGLAGATAPGVAEAVSRQTSFAVSASPSIDDIKRNALLPLQSWWDVLVAERLAVWLVWLILRVMPGLSPNAVTAASLLSALASAYCFLQAEYVCGALLYQLSYVLDNVDGILARFTGTTSALGGIADRLVNIAAYSLNVAALFLGFEGDAFGPAVGIALLLVYILHLAVARDLAKPDDRVWANVVPSGGSFLARNRLLYPLSFPDRHAILFVAGPLTGWIVVSGLLVLFVEVASLAGKLRRLYVDYRDAPPG